MIYDLDVCKSLKEMKPSPHGGSRRLRRVPAEIHPVCSSLTDHLSLIYKIRVEKWQVCISIA
jgi:hypothetical protein